jgi:mannose-1-phosphate guanylyltransferase/mannose-6-phosphate isomerase
LIDDETLIQATAQRAAGLNDVGDPIIVCNEQHMRAVGEQLEAVGVTPRFIVEPVGRNTAPAAAAAALAAGSDALLLILPSDHLIADTRSLTSAVDIATNFATSGHLVTFGVVPDRPETGYGYIRKGGETGAGFHVDSFVEKPDTETAEAYLADGDYLWNSGMFLFRADAYLEALDRHAPEMAAALSATIAASDVGGDTLQLDPVTFAACPADSIDYAVMEHVDNGVVVPLDAGWSDVGSWDALSSLSGKDDRGNAISGDVLVEDVDDSIIRSQSRLVAVLGLNNVVVIETEDAVLVTDKDRAQDVRLIVDRLREAGRPEV